MLFLLLALSQEIVPDWDINYTKTISTSLKANWCGRQIYACKIVCYTQEAPEPKVNTCNDDVLAYKCICGDGIEPKLYL